MDCAGIVHLTNYCRIRIRALESIIRTSSPSQPGGDDGFDESGDWVLEAVFLVFQKQFRLIRKASWGLVCACMNFRFFFQRYYLPLAAMFLINLASLQAEKPLERIAFGSCNRQFLPQPLWTPISAFQPQLWIWLGDNIYGDTDDMKVLAEKWALQKDHPGYKELRATCPIIGIWDDHDYGRNDAGFEYPMKRESQKLLLDFLDEPANSPRRSRSGIYDVRRFGPPEREVCVILLDTRSFRAARRSGGDILGEAQWRWLAETLRNSKSQIHLICSSSQVLPTEHKYEKWADYPDSRKRLFELIKSTKKPGVFFLSGDRHVGEISRIDLGSPIAPVYEITSSGLTHFRDSLFGEPNQLRVGSQFAGLNFGTAEIDWQNQKVIFSIRNAKGESEQRIEAPFQPIP